jgi:antitoxin component of MazEF toxin-antitoxin module
MKIDPPTADDPRPVDEDRPDDAPARRRKYTLDELLARVTDQNLHGEIQTGSSVGREAW